MGERFSWQELTRAYSEDTPRVVLLDGLDELIQGSRISRSDYLEQVQELQRAEEERGRAFTAIVTSRTVVAARTRFPIGSVAVRLEPFSSAQVRTWLRTWSKVNVDYFTQSSLRPLPGTTALKFPDLATQPLLLAMLALYDSEANELQNEEQTFDASQLYENLVTRFSEREVTLRQQGRSRPQNALTELVRLSAQKLEITALGMFNRARQWIDSEELQQDLEWLGLDTQLKDTYGSDFHERLTDADVAIGSFFFVFETRLTRGKSRVTYEFLHPTFGEYLTARLAYESIVDLARMQSVQLISPSIRSGFDYSHSFALLSSELLTSRESILDFCRLLHARRVDESTEDLVHAIENTLSRTHSINFGQLPSIRYAPSDASAVGRLAVYQANLIALLICFQVEPCNLGDLLETDDPVQAWQGFSAYLHSQLMHKAGWDALISSVAVELGEPDAAGEQRLELIRADESLGGAALDLASLQVWPEDDNGRQLVVQTGGSNPQVLTRFLLLPQLASLADIAQPLEDLSPMFSTLIKDMNEEAIHTVGHHVLRALVSGATQDASGLLDSLQSLLPVLVQHGQDRRNDAAEIVMALFTSFFKVMEAPAAASFIEEALVQGLGQHYLERFLNFSNANRRYFETTTLEASVREAIETRKDGT